MTHEATDDRRVQRTLQALNGAFFDLVTTRRYDEIKVADIIESAGVGRSTFYEHFQGKDDMLRKSMQMFFDILADAITDKHDQGRLCFLAGHFWEQRRFVSVFRNPGTRNVIVRALTEAFERRLASAPLRAPPKLLAAALAESQLALLVAWLSGAAPATPGQIAETLAATSRAVADAARGAPTGGPAMKPSTGVERIRPFMPAKDFALSVRYYEALGFEKVLDSEVAIFNTNSGGFILQRAWVEQWAHNFMMQLMVDDLDAWWAHIQSLDLAGRFGVQAPKAPALQPWGLRVAYVYDPSGVLWHICQRRPDAAQD